MKEKIDELEFLAFEASELIEVCRDSCGYNKYFPQEAILTKALATQKLIIEKLFELT